VQTTVSASWNLEPISELGLDFKARGILAAMHVHAGEHVKSVQLLAEVDPTTAQAKLRAHRQARLRRAAHRFLGRAQRAPARRDPQLRRLHHCAKTHCVDLPAPNFSGRGSVFGTKVNQTTTAFRTANARCEHLLTFLACSGAAGASGPVGA